MDNSIVFLAKIRNKICNFFVANCVTNFSRVLFFRLGGGKANGKLFLDRENHFTDFNKVEITGNCIIGKKNVFLSRGGIKIGKNCLFSGYSFILSQSHELESEKFESVYDSIEIGDNCWIATNATILPGTKIKEGCVIGAGTVIGKNDFPEYSVIAGNPAKKIKTRNCKSNIEIK